MKKMKKILVIDGNSIINRAFYGVRPLTTTSGKNTNAVFGTVNMVCRQLEQLQPDYAVVTFDVKAPTFRHRLYADYKAGRKPTPPELSEQFPYVKDILNAMGLTVLEREGYEADDLQGTVAAMAHTAEDTESYILTGDRDLLQLIDDKITVLLATNNDTIPMHEKEFVEKYRIPPCRFVEMKALMGDKSDNIPGVAGIGEKGAGDLVLAFESLEGIYAHLDDPRIKPAMRQKLLDNKENAFLSRTLSKIDTAVPDVPPLCRLARREPDRGALYRHFTELELNTFISRFSLSVKDCETEVCTQGNTEKKETIVYNKADFSIINGLAGKKIALYEEADALYFFDGEAGYCYEGELCALAPLFVAPQTKLLCFEGKKLWHRLDRAGICVGEEVTLLDLSLYAYVINPGAGEATPDSLCAMFLGRPAAPGECPVGYMLALEEKMRSVIAERGGLYILDELEIPLLPCLAEMEKLGFRVNVPGLMEFAEALGALAEELKGLIYQAAGEEFNIQSPKQLSRILFEKMGLGVFLKQKKKRGPSTDAATLEELRPYAPIVEDILEYRQVTKLRSTYAVALSQAADEGSRVHTEFKQALTATGRLSSADPNLQNIPIRTKLGRQMRRYFEAEPGYVLVDADYSQIELRLLAHISEDYHMCMGFAEGEDIHRKTAAAVFGVPEEEVTEEERKRAKAVNFGIVYGISGFSLAKDIGTSVAEAGRYIKNYMYNYPGIEGYLERVVKEAAEDGFTTTPMGRRRYIPELSMPNAALRAFGKRVAMNAPIQGAAADIMKLSMVHVRKRLKQDVPEARLIMQVHDELIVEAPADQAQRVARILKEEMEGAVTLSVPLTVDVTMGPNWLDQE